MSGYCPACGHDMKGSRDNPRDNGHESCATCRWHHELIGLSKPHPHRCDYSHVHDGKDHLDILPKTGWCIRYKPKDGKERTMPMFGGCAWCGRVVQ